MYIGPYISWTSSLHGNLEKEVHIEQPPGLITQGGIMSHLHIAKVPILP